MHQLEIQFFWPLTEQIPLDFDYEGCDTRLKITTSDLLYGRITATSPLTTWGTSVLKLTEDSVTFTYKEEPPWYRKLVLKLIGFDWEKR
jgi:hypothetical protein